MPNEYDNASGRRRAGRSRNRDASSDGNRNVAYEDMSPRERRQARRRAGLSLDQEDMLFSGNAYDGAAARDGARPASENDAVRADRGEDTVYGRAAGERSDASQARAGGYGSGRQTRSDAHADSPQARGFANDAGQDGFVEDSAPVATNNPRERKRAQQAAAQRGAADTQAQGGHGAQGGSNAGSGAGSNTSGSSSSPRPPAVSRRPRRVTEGDRFEAVDMRAGLQRGGDLPVISSSPAGANGQDDVMRVRKKHHKRRKAPVIVVCIVVVLAAVVGIAGFSMYGSAKTLQTQASDVMDDIGEVQTAIVEGDYESAAATAQELDDLAQSMNKEMSSPLWTAASLVPGVGDDVKSVKTVLSSLADVSSDALVPLTQALTENSLAALISEDGDIDVTTVEVLLGAIEEAAPAMQECADTLDGVEITHIQALGSLVEKANEEVQAVNDTFQIAADFAPIVGSFLGADGDRMYLIAAQNTAEMRPGGGFPGSVGTLMVDDGSIDLGDFGTVYDVMVKTLPDGYSITDTEYELFTTRMDLAWDTSFDPDFTRSAAIWAADYAGANDVDIDGVISITPSVVQDVLSIVGPITLSDGTELDGDNATKVLQYDLYWTYLAADHASDSNDVCDALFAEAAELAFDKLLSNLDTETLTAFISVLTDSMSDREIMLWLSDEEEQATLDALNVSGGLNSGEANPELGVYFGFGRASKMGWYLDYETTVSEGVKNADGTTTYQVTTTFANLVDPDEVEAGGSYIMGRLEGNMYMALYFYAPAGGTITDIETSNGIELVEGEHEGLQVYYYHYMDFMPGDTFTCTYTVTTSAAAESELTVSDTPTLEEYYQAASE